MINKLRDLAKIGGLLTAAMLVVSCESELDNLGEQLFEGNSAQGVEKSFGVIGFNNDNLDVVRTDASELGYATLGAFTEPVFGTQKSSYVSQVRMSTDNYDFGTNAVLDSAVLVFKPLYNTDSLKTTTDENYIYPDGNVEAKKVVNTYVVNKYGNSNVGGSKAKFTIRVREVDDFLGAYTDEVKSNKVVNVSANDIGSKVFDGTVNSVVITKKADNSELLNREVGYRMTLDKNFFQNKIVAKSKGPELASAASFIRYFKGIQIAVDETDGYIFKFDPTTVKIRLYYKSDVTAEDGTIKRPQSDYDLVLAGMNAKFNQIQYNRTGTAYASAMANISSNGQSQLFAQGMGGSGFTVRIPAQTIATLRDLFRNDKAGIVTAKIRMYTDTSIWNNSFEKPDYFTVKEKDASAFLSDFATLGNATNYALIKAYDTDKALAYYDIGITKTLKDIVEKGAEAKDLVVNLGSFLSNATGGLIGVDVTDRSYMPNRIVFKGTDFNKIGQEITNSENIQLRVAYSKKN